MSTKNLSIYLQQKGLQIGRLGTAGSLLAVRNAL